MIADFEFFQQSALDLAPALLGKTLKVEHGERTFLARIVETEAYCGLDDKGNHAYQGRRSPKNESMYLPGGHVYVYKCYGVHHMLNIVSGKEGDGEAVLVRAVEPLSDYIGFIENRGMAFKDYRLTGGPGKVCEAMGIHMGHDGISLLLPNAAISLDEGNLTEEIISGPRVGMSHHVAECANWARRFYLGGNGFVSRPLKLWYTFD